MKIFLAIFSIVLICFSCKRKWTEKDKSEFVSACLATAVKDSNIGERSAREYCHCLIEKVVEKYPNARDVQYIKYDKDIVTISRACLEKSKSSVK